MDLVGRPKHFLVSPKKYDPWLVEALFFIGLKPTNQLMFEALLGFQHFLVIWHLARHFEAPYATGYAHPGSYPNVN